MKKTISKKLNHIAILKKFNKWRRGAETKQPSPEIIGQAIDAAIKDCVELKLRNQIFKNKGPLFNP